MGGDTAFYDKRLNLGEWYHKAVTGRALFFNHRGWAHEGKKVIDGVKYMLRSDVMYRKVKQNELEQYVG